MPELPEVQTIAKHLSQELSGLRIEKITVLKTGREKPGGKKMAQVLTGKKIIRIFRRAKLVIWEFEDQLFLITHLKMTGRLILIGKDYQPSKHDRMIFDFKNRCLAWSDVRTFGFMHLMSKNDLDKMLEKYGPEPLEINESQLASRIFSFKRSRIKSALLDQKIIAGIGNIYADEALFAAGINPNTPSWKVPNEKKTELSKAIQNILKKSIKAQGTSFRDYVNGRGEKGGFQNQLKVYGRANQPCLSCGTIIQKNLIAQRGTHFCPKCQS